MATTLQFYAHPVATKVPSYREKSIINDDSYNNQTDVVIIDIERMQQAIESPRHLMPSGLSREEKRQHILNTARNAK